MRVAVAMDSFKGSLTSLEAEIAVKEAVLQIDSAAEVSVRPLADGGDGTVQTLYAGLGGQCVDVAVSGSLGTPLQTGYCILPDGTAIMEMASAGNCPG